jgi:predicted nucleic acid-binding protein
VGEEMRLLSWQKYIHGTMTVVIEEPRDEEDGSGFSKTNCFAVISLESLLEEVEDRFIVLPTSGRACVRAIGLPAPYPKDPADRIIGATALVEGLSLLTADREIRRSSALQTIW